MRRKPDCVSTFHHSVFPFYRKRLKILSLSLSLLVLLMLFFITICTYTHNFYTMMTTRESSRKKKCNNKSYLKGRLMTILPPSFESNGIHFIQFLQPIVQALHFIPHLIQAVNDFCLCNTIDIREHTHIHREKEREKEQKKKLYRRPALQRYLHDLVNCKQNSTS